MSGKQEAAEWEPIEWEPIILDEYDWTDRMQVPGGWLYRNTTGDSHDKSAHMRVVMVFVPKPAA